jgi:hypothetical protein
MKKAQAKFLFAWSAAAVGVLLCWLALASRRTAPATSKVVAQDAPFHAARSQRSVASALDTTAAPEPTKRLPGEPSPRSSIVDEELRRLEQEIRRAAQIENADERKSVLLDACVRWAECDPADAINWVRKLGLAETSSVPIEQLVQKWAAADFQAALAWANREAEGPQRELVMERLAFVRAQNLPSAAARLVAEQIPAGPVQNEATIAVLHQWALSDFSGASSWVDQFPSELQTRARAELEGVAHYRLAQQ